LKEYPRPEGLIGAFTHSLDSTETTLRALEGLNALMRTAPVKALLELTHAAPDGRASLLATGLPDR
jgi:hypothetical protein